MQAAIEAVLILIEQIVGAVGGSSAAQGVIQSVINALLKLIPVIVEFAPPLIDKVKQIIAILEANDATLPDQIAALKAAIPADDAAFDDAEQKAEANDAAADAADAAAAKPGP